MENLVKVSLKDEFEYGNLEFEFEDYIMIEMERIREMVRDRYV